MRSFDERIAQVNRRSKKILQQRKRRRNYLLLCCIPLTICLVASVVLFWPQQSLAEIIPISPAPPFLQVSIAPWSLGIKGEIKVTGPGTNISYTDPVDAGQVLRLLLSCYNTPHGGSGDTGNEGNANKEPTYNAVDEPEEYRISYIPYGSDVLLGDRTREWLLKGNTLREVDSDYVITLTEEEVILWEEVLEIGEALMAKRICINVLAAVVLLSVLFVPLPGIGKNNDYGDTWHYTALTYKVVHWDIPTGSGSYEKTVWCSFPHNFKSLDALWQKDMEPLLHSMTATIEQINGNYVVVRPIAAELHSSDLLCFNTQYMERIDPQVGSEVDIEYFGDITGTAPAPIKAFRWSMTRELC